MQLMQCSLFVKLSSLKMWKDTAKTPSSAAGSAAQDLAKYLQQFACGFCQRTQDMPGYVIYRYLSFLSFSIFHNYHNYIRGRKTLERFQDPNSWAPSLSICFVCIAALGCPEWLQAVMVYAYSPCDVLPVLKHDMKDSLLSEKSIEEHVPSPSFSYLIP